MQDQQQTLKHPSFQSSFLHEIVEGSVDQTTTPAKKRKSRRRSKADRSKQRSTEKAGNAEDVTKQGAAATPTPKSNKIRRTRETITPTDGNQGLTTPGLSRYTQLLTPTPDAQLNAPQNAASPNTSFAGTSHQISASSTTLKPPKAPAQPSLKKKETQMTAITLSRSGARQSSRKSSGEGRTLEDQSNSILDGQQKETGQISTGENKTWSKESESVDTNKAHEVAVGGSGVEYSSSGDAKALDELQARKMLNKQAFEEAEQKEQFKQFLDKAKDQGLLEGIKIDDLELEKALGIQQKANVFTRLDIDEKIQLDPHSLQEMIKNKVKLELMPSKIKESISRADKQFGAFLQVNSKAAHYDFGAGYYFTEPEQKRGHDIAANRDKSAQAADRSLLNKTTMVGDDQAEQTQMNTIMNSTKFSNLTTAAEPVQGGLGLTQIKEEEIDEDVFENLRQAKNQTKLQIQLGVKSHATSIDLQKVDPTIPIKYLIDQQQKNDRQSEVVRKKIMEMRLKDEIDRKMHYLNRQKQVITSFKPPLAPTASAGPASQKSLKIAPDEAETIRTGAPGLQSLGHIPGLRSYLTPNKNTALSLLTMSDIKPTTSNPANDRSMTPGPSLPSIFVDQFGPELLAQQRTKIKLKKRTGSEDGNNFNLPGTTSLPMLNESKATASAFTTATMMKKSMDLQRTRSNMLMTMQHEDDEEENKVAHKVYHDQRVVLIKPAIDASDKELHKRNEMMNAEKNLRKYFEEEGEHLDSRKSFVPVKLGQFSKKDFGVKMNVINSGQDKADFNKKITEEEVDHLIDRLKDVKKNGLTAQDMAETNLSQKKKTHQKMIQMLMTQQKLEEWTVVKPTYGANQTLQQSMLSGTTLDDNVSTAGMSQASQLVVGNGLVNDTSSLFGNVSLLGMQNVERDTLGETVIADQQLDDSQLPVVGSKNDKSDDYDAVQHHKPVYLNKRWHRENDMRQIIRELAENGEKMVQRERSRDFMEDFEETDSNYSAELYDTDSDEEWNKLKRDAAEQKLNKSKRILVKAQKRKLYKLNIAEDGQYHEHYDRNAIIRDGEQIEFISAYDGVAFDELEHRRQLQIKAAEEHIKAMIEKPQEDRKITVGLTPDKVYKPPTRQQDIEIENSEGRKIKQYRYIDKEQAYIEIYDKRKKEKLYRAQLRANKMRRLLDDQKKKERQRNEYIMQKKMIRGKLVDNEIEKILIEKHAVKQPKPVVIEEKSVAQIISKQALIDDIVMDNKNYMRSLALKKRLWTGDNGTFANKELSEWFKVYNQTQLNKVQPFLKQVKMENNERIAIGSYMKRINLQNVNEAADESLEEESPRFASNELKNFTGS